MKWKYVSIDTETLGLDHEYCDLIEFGAVLDNGTAPIEKLPRFHCYLTKDKDRYQGEAFALQMHQQILERIAMRTHGFTYIPGDCLDGYFSGWLEEQGVRDAITVAGKNFSEFDMKFLSRVGFGKQTKLERRVLDVGSMFYNIDHDKTVPNLKECLRRCGHKKEIAHTAIEDAIDVINCIRINCHNRP